jgi:hypothetical protein
MSGKSPVSRSHTTRAEKTAVQSQVAPALAHYDAVLSVDMDRDALTIVDRQLAEQSRTELARAPGYAAWPPAPLGPETDLSTLSVEALVLARMKAVLDFGAKLAGSSGTALRTAIANEWSVLNTARQARAAGTTSPNYERIRAQVTVRADGSAEWGYSRTATSAQPLPLSGVQPDGRTSLDAYVQNQLRAAIADKLAAAA